MDKLIYFDNNATTPVALKVFKAMEPFYKDEYGNASSIHAKGRPARLAIDKARHAIASLIGASDEDIIFTSGGTESDNIAIKGAVLANSSKGNHIITSKTEHSAVLATCKFMEKNGFTVTYLPVNKYGMVLPDDLKNAITEKTVLVTIMHANNETGTINPIKELAAIAKEKKILFHTDAVQSFGKLDTDAGNLGVDLLSVSAHKIHGPKGVGALYVKKGVKITPLTHGGHHERKLRAGTENVPGIIGFAKAAELISVDRENKNQALTNLRNRLHNGISEKINNVYLNGHPTQRLPGTLNLSFRYIEGESIMLNLDMQGVCVSTGSACTSGTLEPSHVLTAMGVAVDIAQGSIRFSLSDINTQSEVDYCISILPEIIKRLRAMSPLKK
ncbi:MAG: cysteine desulfurase NifS [Candidatus Omnitrophica bacterium CG12_big_fil_rev_8_21_14_0_65_43_15]|uniref:Cysteine desulfurase IscS n=1 Tax=Candidatus Taenaricola geysiri TaxID=1974752 RepID=A0A2J0LGD0_9BACT|nr:MAG: cysteine desulfurase NifS [Candidatus Omnitrophica bacterium CG03_land_8_20_14_0_80_43_22]PIW65924.1 MAG: cysteine desulfurase NifS [Candidatus Omnitrophica bacterium CG12_big_fil_rev_8_21_14_0_65_43_15]PIY84544.1 MAG: cysteine desulfurase NifS [Candidatus Omnitrophica bacterium CG_4_10_14_0_8_um_filter_43_18]